MTGTATHSKRGKNRDNGNTVAFHCISPKRLDEPQIDAGCRQVPRHRLPLANGALGHLPKSHKHGKCWIVALLRPMLPQEQAEMDRLCRLIQVEKDRKKFSDLIAMRFALLVKSKSHLEIASVVYPLVAEGGGGLTAMRFGAASC